MQHVFALHCVLQFLTLIIAEISATISIISDTDMVFLDNCILRRTNVIVNSKDPCYKCTERSDVPSILESIQQWPQPYFDCTNYCPRKTICSQKKYYDGIENVPRSLCYNCENLKTEDITFEFVRDDDLCAAECSACASVRDLAQATMCASSCNGFPTFCFPLRRWFGKIIKCFKATYWYGCDFIETPKTNLTKECIECAMIATNRDDAQECGYACQGIPMYHVHPKNDKVGKSEQAVILKCRPHVIDAEKNGVGSYFMEDLFLYDLQDSVLKYLRFSIPTSIYPGEYLSKQYIPGPVAKDIFKNFSMFDLTFPMPKRIQTK